MVVSSDILSTAGHLNPVLKLIRKSVGLTNLLIHLFQKTHIFKKPTFSKTPHFQKTHIFKKPTFSKKNTFSKTPSFLKHSDVILDLTPRNLTEFTLTRFDTCAVQKFFIILFLYDERRACDYGAYCIFYTFTLYDVKVTLYTCTLKVTFKSPVTVKVTVKGTVTVTTKVTLYIKVTLYVAMFKNVLNNYRDQKTVLNN